jgi:hypothetical protein
MVAPRVVRESSAWDEGIEQVESLSASVCGTSTKAMEEATKGDGRRRKAGTDVPNWMFL